MLLSGAFQKCQLKKVLYASTSFFIPAGNTYAFISSMGIICFEKKKKKFQSTNWIEVPGEFPRTRREKKKALKDINFRDEDMIGKIKYREL